MCLNNLKAFDKRVLDLALPDLADNSLRGPTTQELGHHRHLSLRGLEPGRSPLRGHIHTQ